jgi:hypothetical protein
MNRGRWLGSLAVLAAWLAIASTATADRTPTVRAAGQRTTGTRPDITVPYLNHGLNAFQADGVAPRIYSSPAVDNPVNPLPRPIFNLIFYGSNQRFGDKSNGAGERPPNTLRPQKSP